MKTTANLLNLASTVKWARLLFCCQYARGEQAKKYSLSGDMDNSTLIIMPPLVFMAIAIGNSLIILLFIDGLFLPVTVDFCRPVASNSRVWSTQSDGSELAITFVISVPRDRLRCSIFNTLGLFKRRRCELLDRWQHKCSQHSYLCRSCVCPSSTWFLGVWRNPCVGGLRYYFECWNDVRAEPPQTC